MEPDGRLLPDSKLERVSRALSKDDRLLHACALKEEWLWALCRGRHHEWSW